MLTSIGLFSCQDKHSQIPQIEFVSVSQQYMTQGGNDSLYLKFNFTDGNGDIGSDTSDNIFVSDSRTGAIIASYKIPNYLGTNPNNSSRTGEITLVVYSQCCIYPNGSSCQSSTDYPTRTMHYEIKVQDQAGNYSNTIQSDEITLECL